MPILKLDKDDEAREIEFEFKKQDPRDWYGRRNRP